GRARANGYLYSSQMATESVIGPALGGVLYAAASALPFAVDGLTFVMSAVLLAPVVRPGAPRRRAGSRLVAEVGQGLRWFLRQRALRLMALVITSYGFCQAMVYAVLVLWATAVLHLSGAGYGLFLAIAAVGHVAGALWAPRLYRRLGAGACVVGGGVLCALAYAAAAATTRPMLALLCFVVEMTAISVGNVASVAYRQSVIPPEMMGRVGNAMRTCIWGAMPLGAVTGGVVAGLVGLRPTLLVAGALQLGVLMVVGPALLRVMSLSGTGSPASAAAAAADAGVAPGTGAAGPGGGVPEVPAAAVSGR
ncbi:MAG TPA: MFS transporter, partial [Acidimicrobiales bacterium]|nr:MFS transporter [Acidimicrobiales bacterium]